MCAGEQAQFWDYHELLFANQRSLSVTNLVGYAAQLGLDAESFLTCLDADATRLQIEQDMSVAKALGAPRPPPLSSSTELWCTAPSRFRRFAASSSGKSPKVPLPDKASRAARLA